MTLPINRPADHTLAAALEQLEAGRRPAELEKRGVDFKEEAGRRKGHEVLPGSFQNEDAAKKLAPEVACFANTPGAGAIVLGVADDGQRIGTNLDTEWLRHRLYQLTGPRGADTEIFEYHLADGTRLLVIRVSEALEPIFSSNRLTHRVDDNCVDVSIEDWLAHRPIGSAHDWSGQPSGSPATEARPGAVQVARDLLARGGDPSGLLNAATDVELLERIGATSDDGFLTNAGLIAFVGTGPGNGALDYARRPHHGADSEQRIDRTGLSVLEELDQVLTAINLVNNTTHRPAGGQGASALVRPQLHDLPDAPLREAIVNGLAHRDWQRAERIAIEHIGSELSVVSPGGFVGGVTASNIITHTPVTRNRALAGLLQKLRLAEREGIGVDRMVADMLAAGHAGPVIDQQSGPNVRAVLLGGPPDEEWMAALDAIGVNDDVSLLLILDQITRNGWTDRRAAAPLIQRSLPEATGALRRLADLTIGSDPVIEPVKGTPPTADPAWRPSVRLRALTPQRQGRVGHHAARPALGLAWALHRGRISSTELADLSDVGSNHVAAALKELVEQGLLEPGRESKGRSFFYVPTEHAQAQAART